MNRKKAFVCLAGLVCASALAVDLMAEGPQPDPMIEGTVIEPLPDAPSPPQAASLSDAGVAQGPANTDIISVKRATHNTQSMMAPPKNPPMVALNVGGLAPWTPPQGGHNPAVSGDRALQFDLSPGTGPPPDTLGSYPMTPFEQDDRPLYEVVTTVPSPYPIGGDIEFSIPMGHRRIGQGWWTWSHGYTGDVYFTTGAASVTITLPQPACAFYFYVEPNAFSSKAFTAVASDGASSGSFWAEGSSGATYVGVFGEGLEWVTISTDDGVSDFAVGEFGIGCSCDPVYVACCDEETGACTDGLDLLTCIERDWRWEMDISSCGLLDPPCGWLTGACCVGPAGEPPYDPYECIGDMAMSDCLFAGEETIWYPDQTCEGAPPFDCEAPTYCDGSGGCVEYISRVLLPYDGGTIDNETGCTQYGDYTDTVALVSIGLSYDLSVWNGYVYSGDETMVWIDWNGDKDWYDDGEFIGTVVGQPQSDFAVLVPPMAIPGHNRMRIRIDRYPSAPPPYGPCGSTTHGEVEDYTVLVSSELPTGACCDPYTGDCADDVESPDCLPPLQFHWEQTCASLDPPCGNPGACCDDFDPAPVACEDDVLELNCAGTRFAPLPATCADFDPPCAFTSPFFVFDPGTGPPPEELCEYPMTPFPLDDSSAVYDDVWSVPSPCPTGGAIEFSTPLSHRRIGSGWMSWSHGYTGDVYYSNEETEVTITLPQPACAFYFYVEPNPFELHTFKLTINGVIESEEFMVDGYGGAAFAGVCAIGLETITVQCTSGADFAIGEFGIACLCEPMYVACCDELTGACTDGLDVLTCIERDWRWDVDVEFCADLDPPCGEVLGACCCGPLGEEGVCEPYECIADMSVSDCLAAGEETVWAEGESCEGYLPYDCGAPGLLYAPSQPDNPSFRADIEELIGKTCDYFDPRYATPTLEELQEYIAVFTWVNYAYADKVAMGDVLADYVDAGGVVILGQWTYHTTQVNWLEGRIMTEGYCPATASFYTPDSYAGDGFQCPTLDVDSFSSSYFDQVTAAEGAFSDGTTVNGSDFVCYRPSMNVWYSPGNTGLDYTVGDVVQLTANMYTCGTYWRTACCHPTEYDPATGAGVCEDRVHFADCMPPLEFHANQTCASLYPPCGNPGACCDDIGDACTDGVLELNCAGTRFAPLPATCADFDPACGDLDFTFVFDPGTGPPPETLCGSPMTDFPLDDSSAVYDDITSIPVPCPTGGEIEFSTPMSHRRIGSGWMSWSHGYSEDVYYTNGATEVTITLPPAKYDFYFYVQPNPFEEHSFKLIANGVIESEEFTADGDGGAAYAGVCTHTTQLETITIECTSSPPVDFAIGEFGICCFGPGSWGPCCDPYTGICTDDVEVLSCPPPLQWWWDTLCADLDPPCGNPGACCDIFTGECNDPVLELNCDGARFEPGQQCAELEPECGNPGACCMDNPPPGEDPPGECTIELEANCAGRFVAGTPCDPDPFDPPCGEWECSGILYAPSDADNPTWRAQVAALCGCNVDYWDARISTPTLEDLLGYCSVFTWANYAYANAILFGDTLAAYVDAGGRVILGQWTFEAFSGTPGPGGSVIVEPEYCPVTVSHWSEGTYAGDGTDCVHVLGPVSEYASSYCDQASPRPGAVTDGTFVESGLPAVIWRADRQLYYSPGNTGGDYTTGDTAQLVANMCACTDGPLEGACCDPTDSACTNGVMAADCMPPLEFHYQETCETLDPPCGNPGCCCADHPPAEEPPPGEAWQEFEVNCQEGRFLPGVLGQDCHLYAFTPPCGEYEACEHSITMWDDYGDGWNGGWIDVYVDGDLVLAGVTLLYGTGPETVYFEAGTGSVIETIWTPGGWPYEPSYCIYDGFGDELGCDGEGSAYPIGITVIGNCEPPVGGCCMEYDGCEITMEEDCTGEYRGDDTDCGNLNDCDGDGITDLCGIEFYEVPDCNGNWIPDHCDIAAGTSADCQDDGIPDECQLNERPFCCGDGYCSPAEDCETCEEDCGECPYCGDGICQPEIGETTETCPEDCVCPECADFCVTAPGVFPGDTCGAGNDCDHRPSEEQIIEVTIPEDGQWVFSLCEDTYYYDTYLFLDAGCCEDTIASNDDGPGACGLQSEITEDLIAGIYYLVIEAYGSTSCGVYNLDVYLLEGPGSGDCCYDHYPETGCEDPVCEESVCSYDPFCCDYGWDSICADEAASDPACDCGGAARDFTYQYDDGSTENSLGLAAGGELVWIHHFTAEPGAEAIDTIMTSFGSPQVPGSSGVSPGMNVRVYVWCDPAGAGQATGADIIRETTAAAEASAIETDDPQAIAIEPVCIIEECPSESFFVGASVLHAAGGYPAPMDQTSPVGESWLAYVVGGPFDPTDMSSALDMAAIGYPCNFLLRANGIACGPPINDCNENGVPDECDLDCNDNCIPDDCEEEPVTCGDLDLKPGSCPNSFNRGSHGVLPVALMGTEDLDEYGSGQVFDLSEVDISSIRLSRADGVGGEVAPHEGPPGPHTVFEDVATPFVEAMECECADLDGDGITDISMKFQTDEVVPGLALDELPPGALVPVVITGCMAGTDQCFTTPVDCLRLVPPHGGGASLTVEASMPGVWVDISPPDLTLDTGGFADFVRVFPTPTMVSLTAEESFEGQQLRGWQIGGLLHHMGETTLEVTIDQDMTVSAVYGSTPSGGTPKPPGGMTPGEMDPEMDPESPTHPGTAEAGTFEEP